MRLEIRPATPTPLLPASAQAQEADSEAEGIDLSRPQLPEAASASGFGPACDHDATLVPLALEQLGAQRAAIEWLLDAELLPLLLV